MGPYPRLSRIRVSARYRFCSWTAVGLACLLAAGCLDESSAPAGSRTGHEALLAEYQGIANQASAIIRAHPDDAKTDPAVVAEIKRLAERVMDLTHRKLSLAEVPTAEQIQRYDGISAQFQASLHAACPTCPK